MIYFLEVCFIFIYILVHVIMCGYVHAFRGQKILGLLEMELNRVLSYPTWVLGTELGSSLRIANILSRWSISPVPKDMILKTKTENFS